MSLDHTVPHSYRASLPAPNPTRSFWSTSTDLTAQSAEGSTGPLTDDADLCIIGSGITGVSAAYHFARILQSKQVHQAAGGMVKVVILEARDFCE